MLIAAVVSLTACCPEADRFAATIHAGDPLRKALEGRPEFWRATFAREDAAKQEFENFEIIDGLSVLHGSNSADVARVTLKSQAELADYMVKSTQGKAWKATFFFHHFPIRLRVDTTITAEGKFANLEQSPDD